MSKHSAIFALILLVASTVGLVYGYDPVINSLTSTSTTAPLSAAKGKELNDNLNLHKGLINNPHEVTKGQVGLGNVDNTSDLNKPVSTATQNALDSKVPVSTFANYTGNDRITKSEAAAAYTPKTTFDTYSGSKLSKNNPVFTGTLSNNAPDGSHYVLPYNTSGFTGTSPTEGMLYTDGNGKLWQYHSGAWVEKGAGSNYTLPTATDTTLGGVKVGSTLKINAGVLDVMASSLTASGLITAGLSGDQTVSTGFAYITTETGKWTFNTYTSSKQFSLFANYTGTLCAASGSKIYWSNPITFENQSSICAKVPKVSRITAQMNSGKIYATCSKNLQKRDSTAVVVSSCTSGVATVTIAAGGPNQSGASYDTYTYGQSWTPTESGTIYSVSVMFWELPNPSTTSLVIRTGNSGDLSTTYDTTQTFSLAGKVPGVQYEFVLDAHPSFTNGVKKYVMFGSSGGGYNNRFTMNQSNSNPYTGGGILSGTSWVASENTSNDLTMVVKKCQ